MSFNSRSMGKETYKLGLATFPSEEASETEDSLLEVRSACEALWSEEKGGEERTLNLNEYFPKGPKF